MRISRRENSSDGSDALRQNLDVLATTALGKWPVCGAQCPCKTARRCDRNCPDIATALSDDPADNPLELIIAPLVYELQRLDGFRSCWSCEGHERFNELWKKPQVWFYAESQLHVRVLSDAVTEMRIKGALKVGWEISVTYSDPDNLDTTYTLQPRQDETSIGLDVLQSDVASLAASLVSAYTKQAKFLLTTVT